MQDDGQRGDFFGGGNMQDIFQIEITNRGMNNRVTNMTNIHTCATSSVHLISTIVLLSEGELV
jgi:hypothetical protein